MTEFTFFPVLTVLSGGMVVLILIWYGHTSSSLQSVYPLSCVSWPRDLGEKSLAGKFMSSEKILGALPQVSQLRGCSSIQEKTPENRSNQESNREFSFWESLPRPCPWQDRTLEPGWAGKLGLPRVGHSAGRCPGPAGHNPKAKCGRLSSASSPAVVRAAPQRLSPADPRNCRSGASGLLEAKFAFKSTFPQKERVELQTSVSGEPSKNLVR